MSPEHWFRVVIMIFLGQLVLSAMTLISLMTLFFKPVLAILRGTTLWPRWSISHYSTNACHSTLFAKRENIPHKTQDTSSTHAVLSKEWNKSQQHRSRQTSCHYKSLRPLSDGFYNSSVTNTKLGLRHSRSQTSAIRWILLRLSLTVTDKILHKPLEALCR